MQGKAWRAARRLAAFTLAASFGLAAAAAASTLQETLTKTYQTNPDLAAERARVREVDEGVAQANAKWRPSLSLETEIERTSERGKDNHAKYNLRTESWSADIVATQPLFTGGRNATQKGLAMARVRSARARLRIKEQRVLMDAITAYVDAARNELVLDLVREDVALLQALLKEVSDRRDRKQSTDSDVDQTTAALEAARAQCLSDLAALQDSWRAYEQVVGEPPAVTSPPSEALQVNPCVDARGDRLRSTVTLPVDLVAAPGSLNDVEKAAQGDVPELDEARAEEEASRYAVSASYAELLPHASLTARLGTSGEEYEPEWTREASISAELTVPLFNTGAEWSEIRAAREANNRARLNIASTQRQVMRDALHAWYDLVSIRAVRSVNKVQAQSLLRAFEGLRKEMADPKLHRSVTDLLGLRQAYLGARTLLVNSQRDEAIAIYRLMAATGHLNAAFLRLPVERYDPDANLKAQAGRLVGDSIHGE
jgi:outer membrane protein